MTDGHEYRIRIQSLGPRSPGTHTTILQVQTDHPSLKSIPVVATVFVSGEIVAAPTSLFLVSSATNVPRVQYLGVYSPSGKAFKLTGVEAPGLGLETTFTNVSPDRYRIEVRSSGPLDDANGKAIRLETDVEGAKEILVPLHVIHGQDSAPPPTRP